MLLSKNDIVSKYNISERTFDRYRKKLKFETFKQGRIIMFDENEVEKAMLNLQIISNDKFNKKKYIKLNNINDYTKTKDDNDVQTQENKSLIIEQNNAQKQEYINNKFFENEYIQYLKNEVEYLKKDLNEKNQMIESANYKVGKLETLVNLNNNVLNEHEINKVKVVEMNIIIEKQKDYIKSLKINFYIVVIFAFILILFEIYLFISIITQK